jgi:hypothetical protein
MSPILVNIKLQGIDSVHPSTRLSFPVADIVEAQSVMDDFVRSHVCNGCRPPQDVSDLSMVSNWRQFRRKSF